VKGWIALVTRYPNQDLIGKTADNLPLTADPSCLLTGVIWAGREEHPYLPIPDLDQRSAQRTPDLHCSCVGMSVMKVVDTDDFLIQLDNYLFAFSPPGQKNERGKIDDNQKEYQDLVSPGQGAQDFEGFNGCLPPDEHGS
jgi:hypothetical protein